MFRATDDSTKKQLARKHLERNPDLGLWPNPNIVREPDTDTPAVPENY
jgi:hypothetical protein